ncbi:MAG: ribonuclease HII, partial [Dehalococcoidia bacterium]
MARRPTWAEERRLHRQGYHFIAGLDEVGRGALAGPVVAAAIVLPKALKAPWLAQVRDSKELTPARRERLFAHIQEAAPAVGIGLVPAQALDALGSVAAPRVAMGRAIEQLSPPPDFLLIDALKLPALALPQRSMVRGDTLCLSIACASIVAKVTRDRLMREMDGRYPGYGFARHKGYGTGVHLSSLGELGACPIHRRSFAPVAKGLSARGAAIRNILLVCSRNTCRSPMAEAIFRRLMARDGVLSAQGIAIGSRGLSAPEGGLATHFAMLVMAERGLSLEEHRATSLTPEAIEGADLILAMEARHKERVLRDFAGARGRLFTLAEYIGESQDVADPSPYGFVDEYRRCADHLEDYMARLVE